MGAKLVIAHLDRLARNLHFVSTLQERGVDFVAADMPDANRLTIHITTAVAEPFGRTISENTKNALAAAKARGVKLGNPNGARALRGEQVANVKRSHGSGPTPSNAPPAGGRPWAALRRVAGHNRDTVGSLSHGSRCRIFAVRLAAAHEFFSKLLKLLALPRGLEPLFSP